MQMRQTSPQGWPHWNKQPNTAVVQLTRCVRGRLLYYDRSQTAGTSLPLVSLLS